MCIYIYKFSYTSYVGIFYASFKTGRRCFGPIATMMWSLNLNSRDSEMAVGITSPVIQTMRYIMRLQTSCTSPRPVLVCPVTARPPIGTGRVGLQQLSRGLRPVLWPSWRWTHVRQPLGVSAFYINRMRTKTDGSWKVLFLSLYCY